MLTEVYHCCNRAYLITPSNFLKMKRLFCLFALSICFLLSSCKKSNTPVAANDSLPVGTTLVSGNFVSNAHPSSGTVKVVTDVAGKKSLVFQDFKTDNGPDLRIWLSPNTSANPFQEIGSLKAVSGNFSYELDASINYTTNNRVLIWCKGFSVLFGHAVLQ